MKKILFLTLILPFVACENKNTPAEGAQQEGRITKLKYGSRDHYSPNAGDDFPNNVYFGDTHLHTSYSTDAGLFGNVLGPEEAYRFAKGEMVTSSTGVDAQLLRPLDFLVVSDHAENLGLSPMIQESNPDLLSIPWGKEIHDLVKAGKLGDAYAMWGAKVTSSNDPINSEEIMRSMWERNIDAAEKHNNPGKFTAFIGFEWTSSPGGSNLHRNIIFRDNGDKTRQILPMSVYDSEDPEDLWKYLENYEKLTGGRVLAIPHNGNLSNGLMFDDVTLTSKKPIDRDYAIRRAKWEPLYEVTQMKGDGEAHPSLSNNDEFADFETWDKGSFGGAKDSGMIEREYAREALKRGMVYEAKLGINPFKFGMIGSTDSHTSLASTSEDNHFGKVTAVEPSEQPTRFDEMITGYLPDPKGRDYTILHKSTGAAGLAAVWSRENTRESLWDAMSRKEVYATTGTRIRVRMFAGYHFTEEDIVRPDFAKHGYANGVPMGADMKKSTNNESPTFIIKALKDPDWANLDRIQIIKGWVDNDGVAQEQVYDVAVSGNRIIDANGRCKANVGNTVNASEATFDNSIGDQMLLGFWKDPNFDPSQSAFYYVRVLEIPTPRWTTYDAKFFGVNLPKDVPSSIQERAYTSPIWYSPK